ncbi:sensor histidine kinase NtrY-like [Paracoccus pacificus]|uniref:histidine kinase n=1 Tax=Paracoccus pacificus TaxID=1463598 RepID=A0ABW4RAQ2_9RHOB
MLDRWPERLARLRRQRRWQTAATLGLVVLGPLLALASFVVLGPMAAVDGNNWLRLVLMLDLVYFLLLSALVIQRLVAMIAARRRSAAGSRLHLRLTGVFGLVALVPAVLVALFAGLTLNIGLEGWFSDRVRQVVGTSLAAAEAYQNEHRRDLTQDAEALAQYLDRAGQAQPFLDDGEMRQLLTQGQAAIQRGLREAYVIDGSGTIRARGERSYLFWYEKPAPEDLKKSREDGVVLIEDWSNNEFRALVWLQPLRDRYLYVTRDVDGSLLGLLDDTRATVGLYNELEATRGRVLLEFSLVYLGFALLLVAAAVWLGLWFAERLSRPIGRIAAASVAVGEGNLDLQIPEPDTGDEIQTLGQSFNRMTRQLKAQREELLVSHRQSEDQRRLFDSVLTSVTSGVIGLDAAGEIDFLNRSATLLLGLDAKKDHDKPLVEAVPEFADLFDRLTSGVAEFVQDEVRLVRDGRMENLLVRMAIRRGTDRALEGYVVALDDITDLVGAQRMAAWGDVARRVAHEIKNPLTPIQLSAERLKRKFMPLAGNDAPALEQYTDVIIRQTNDLRRIIDEFSRFARMPEPDRKPVDVAKLLRDSVLIQQDALHGAELVARIPDHPVVVDCDATMIGQALTNLLKNAGEAIEERRKAGDTKDWVPEVDVTMTATPEAVEIAIIDNGNGLPPDRSRLFDPYVTMKTGGTGLGLPIVKKIIEEHGGRLYLTDAPGHRGAMAEIRLPIAGTQTHHAARARNHPAADARTEGADK